MSGNKKGDEPDVVEVMQELKAMRKPSEKRNEEQRKKRTLERLRKWKKKNKHKSSVYMRRHYVWRKFDKNGLPVGKTLMASILRGMAALLTKEQRIAVLNKQIGE